MVHFVDTFPGRELWVDGTSYLYFGGTAYLGLQMHPDFQKLFIENIKSYGTNYGASRRSNIQLPVFDRAERFLANFVGSQACITLSSGYLAGQFMATYFDQKGHPLIYAPNTHSAVYHQSGTVAQDENELLELINKALQKRSNLAPVVFLDSVDFEGVNHPEYKSLQNLPLEDLILVIDDSHGIGIIGDEGSGAFRTVEALKAKKTFVCASLGKGFGIQAGALFGDVDTLQDMREMPYYGGASPACPAAVATLLQAEELYKGQRHILGKHMALFEERIAIDQNFVSIKGHPSYSFYNPQWVKHLKDRGILITDFKYPNESAAVKSRIVLSAHHGQEDVLRLVGALKDCLG